MSDRPPEEVKIKLKHGDWEVEITCIESRLKQVVDDLLSSLDATKLVDPETRNQIDALRRDVELLKTKQIPGIVSAARDGGQKIAKGGMTCRGLLDSLWLEDYFATERALGEVHEELSRRGYNYDRTAVSHSLADMVRENILTRTGTMRNFRYIQKKPPGG